MPASDAYDTTGIEYYAIPSFTFASGTTLHELKVAYKSINPSSTKGVVLIPTCYGGRINTTLSFTTAPHDCLKDYHVVVVAMLGNGESSSPSNKPFFPVPGELHYQDCIRAQHQLLTEHLGVRELEAVIGFSMGAQQAYYWAVMYPHFVKKVVAICGSARTSPHNYAFLEGPIGGLTNAIDYVAWTQMKEKKRRGEGEFKGDWEKLRPERGLRAFGRAYSAWLASAAWFRERWWSGRGEAREEEEGNADAGLGFKDVEEFIVKASEEAFLSWDAEDLLVLGRMWQLGDVGRVIPGEEMEVATLGGGVGDDEMFRKALASVQAEVLVMPCRTDQYFPPEDSEIEVKYLKKGTFAPIESIWGHFAGGGFNERDTMWMNERIGNFLAG
jgi:homoserine acetyltransferase